MDIKYAVLGYLSWKPFSGYDLKKLIADSSIFYWSGNNNQIYTALVELHKDGLVTNQVELQEHLPNRKVYSITDSGLAALKEWVLSAPELSQIRKTFLVQLAWSNQLTSEELSELIGKYESEVNMELIMQREKQRREGLKNPSRTAREKYIWKMISENLIRSYEMELAWTRELKNNLNKY
jgi:PadR family transcriptional regulator, regulatory protein AphA